MGRLGARAVLASRVEVRVDRVRFTGGMACTKERIKSGKKLDTVTDSKRRGMRPCSRKQTPCLACNQDETKKF